MLDYSVGGDHVWFLKSIPEIVRGLKKNSKCVLQMYCLVQMSGVLGVRETWLKHLRFDMVLSKLLRMARTLLLGKDYLCP